MLLIENIVFPAIMTPIISGDMSLQLPSVESSQIPLSAPQNALSDSEITAPTAFYDRFIAPSADSSVYDLPSGYVHIPLALKLPEELYSQVMNPRRRGTVISWDQYKVVTSPLSLRDLCVHTEYGPHHLYKQGLPLIVRHGSPISILKEYVSLVGENTPLNLAIIPVIAHIRLHRIKDPVRLSTLTNKLIQENAFQWHCLGQATEEESKVIRKILIS